MSCNPHLFLLLVERCSMLEKIKITVAVTKYWWTAFHPPGSIPTTFTTCPSIRSVEVHLLFTNDIVKRWPLTDIMHFDLLFRDFHVPNATELVVSVGVPLDVRARLRPYPPPLVFQQHIFEILHSHSNFASIEHLRVSVSIGPQPEEEEPTTLGIQIPLRDLPSLKHLELESDFPLRPLIDDDHDESGGSPTNRYPAFECIDLNVLSPAFAVGGRGT